MYNDVNWFSGKNAPKIIGSSFVNANICVCCLTDDDYDFQLTRCSRLKQPFAEQSVCNFRQVCE